MPETATEEDIRENWDLVNTPLGEHWSGRTRYAAAMYFHKKGEMSLEALEAYRICARLDHQDPLSIIRQRGTGKDWLRRFGL